ncbi:MAG: 16S rRNA (guanine(966)-N(2))-methyltransferase RsmD [Anaerolineaceae bacterium]|nr:16S rRNA (guanine(966)-N(2))-methyltransferase RsmD [Anaerolineaceae bacterium]MBN2677480.1 16S rRNA (guanine(966)-N(2))-methyltransferase RsmD [Anaerolineaceae bacterium]
MSNPRIIAGSARGIRLKAVPGDTTRPITDRVKESLFNIIGSDVINSSWLDLFAGTGSVGIEALSRGAGFTQFLDKERNAINTINKNLQSTHLSNRGKVIHIDSFDFIKGPPSRKFDYIFIAPPQYHGMWLKALNTLDANADWLAPNGWIIVQIDPVEYQEATSSNFTEFDQRRYGSTLLLFFR